MVKALPLASESSHFDANQVASMVGVQGTLGTSDVGGTAPTVAFGGNPLTGAQYVELIAGTLNVGTVTSSLAINSGTLSTLGTVGSITNLGSFTNGGTVKEISNLAGGTVLNTGTNVNIVTGSLVGTILGGTVQNLNNGTLAVVTSITNLVGGTVQLNRIPTIPQATFGTIGTTAATVFGTLAGGTGSGAGTEIFVTSLSLTMPSTAGSQDISIGFGTNGGTFHAGTGRLVRGNFPAGGGIAKVFDPPINSGTNAQLTYFQAGAGTVNVDVTFFTTPSTL